MEKEKRLREQRGEKLAPAVIGATLKVFEAIAPKEKKEGEK